MPPKLPTRSSGIALGLFAVLMVWFIATSCGDLQMELPGFSANQPGQVTISIAPGATSRGPLAFGSNPLVLERNAEVTWVNNDSINHTATARAGTWDSGDLAPGGSFRFQFTASGSFDYYCRNHPTETGLIVIEVTSPSPTVPASPTPAPVVSALPGTIPPLIPLPIPIPAPSPVIRR